MSGLEAPVLAAIIGGGSLLGSTALGAASSKKVTQPGAELMQTQSPEAMQAMRDAYAQVAGIDPAALQAQYASPYGGQLNAAPVDYSMLFSALQGIGQAPQQGMAGREGQALYSSMGNQAPANIYDVNTPEGQAREAMRKAITQEAANNVMAGQALASERYAQGGTLGSSGWGRSLGDITKQAVEGVASQMGAQDIGQQQFYSNQRAAQQAQAAQGLTGIDQFMNQMRSYADMNKLNATQTAAGIKGQEQQQSQENLNRQYADFLRTQEQGMNLGVNLPLQLLQAALQYGQGTAKTVTAPGQVGYAPSAFAQATPALGMLAQMFGSGAFNGLFGSGGSGGSSNPFANAPSGYYNGTWLGGN